MYGRDTPNAHYGLAKLSGTGLDHDSACHYFGEDSELSKYAISLPAFDELEDGAIRAHLAMPLKFSVCPKSLFVLVSELGRVSLLTTKVDVGSAKDFYKS